MSAQPLRFTQRNRPHPNHHVGVCMSAFCWGQHLRTVFLKLSQVVLAIQVYWKSLESQAWLAVQIPKAKRNIEFCDDGGVQCLASLAQQCWTTQVRLAFEQTQKGSNRKVGTDCSKTTIPPQEQDLDLSGGSWPLATNNWQQYYLEADFIAH